MLILHGERPALWRNLLAEPAVRRIATPAFVLLIVLLWSMTHRYLGLGGDARLYAVQAFARLHPNLFDDLYLSNTSQDSFTIFSSFYARCIGLMGLHRAALTLTLLCKIGYFVGAWALARRLTYNFQALFMVAFLVAIPCGYGAFGVFHCAEDWLTARSLAEALVIGAMALWFNGSAVLASLVMCSALWVHPLMALPGLLMMICLRLPFRVSVAGAIVGVIFMLGLSLISPRFPQINHLLVVMDPSWLEVVRERSQFLFLQLWRDSDWNLNLRPFLALALAALVLRSELIHKISVAAILVGATGLAIAFTASTVLPVGLLLQGQAWRWVWLVGFFSVLLLPSTIAALWRERPRGLLCAILLLCGWVFPTIGSACLVASITLWQVRYGTGLPTPRYALGATLVVATAALAWSLRSSSNTTGVLSSGSAAIASFAHSSALELASITIFTLWAHWIKANRSPLTAAVNLIVLASACLYFAPRALRDAGVAGTAPEIRDFEDWRRLIPESANVLFLPSQNSAAFVWFTLERPSYLTVDQSSGVVFSRETALEVRRRSEVLLPMMDPDWRLWSLLEGRRRHPGVKAPLVRPLATDRLTSICRDSTLKFVIAAEDVGYAPLRHSRTGSREDWYLYDCRRVIGAQPPV
jgi:hypothetical protein